MALLPLRKKIEPAPIMKGGAKLSIFAQRSEILFFKGGLFLVLNRIFANEEGVSLRKNCF